MSDENFALICEFCGNVFCTFEDFRSHVMEHFPQTTPNNVKRENSISVGSDYDPIDMHNNDFKGILHREVADTGDISEIQIKQEVFTITNVADRTDFAETFSLRQANDTESSNSRPNNTSDVASKALAGRKIDFKCSFCGKILKGCKERDDHENTHTGNRPYVCAMCPRTFSLYTALLSHTRCHKTDMRFKCSMCDEKFARKYSVDNHTREVHLPDTDPRRYFPCKACDAKFKSYSQLSWHRQTLHRTNSELFTCDYCQKQTTRKLYMVLHMKVHTDRKIFKCKYCDKKFSTNGGKWRHEKKKRCKMVLK